MAAPRVGVTSVPASVVAGLAGMTMGAAGMMGRRADVTGMPAAKHAMRAGPAP